MDPTCELADAFAETGAPFELFWSADEGFVLDLAREGMTEDQGAVYARGRLAILAPKRSPLALPAHVVRPHGPAAGDRARVSLVSTGEGGQPCGRAAQVPGPR